MTQATATAMTTALERCRAEYRRALAEFLAAPGREDASLRAYELGRQALASGIGLLEIVTLHHDALTSTLQASPAEVATAAIRSAELFLIERRLIDGEKHGSEGDGEKDGQQNSARPYVCALFT